MICIAALCYEPLLCVLYQHDSSDNFILHCLNSSPLAYKTVLANGWMAWGSAFGTILSSQLICNFGFFSEMVVMFGFLLYLRKSQQYTSTVLVSTVHLSGGEVLFFSLGVDFTETIIARMHFPVPKNLNFSGLNELHLMSTQP
jgi:hypothetical protein